MSIYRKFAITFLSSQMLGFSSWGANLQVLAQTSPFPKELQTECEDVSDGEQCNITALIALSPSPDKELGRELELGVPKSEECAPGNSVTNMTVTSPLYSLPFEVVVEIIDYLSDIEISRLRTCCVWWRYMVDRKWNESKDKTNQFWKTRYDANFCSAPPTDYGSKINSILGQYFCFLNFFHYAPPPIETEISWKKAFRDKSTHLARQNSIKAWLMIWNGTTQEDRYFCGANLSNWQPSALAHFDFSHAKFSFADFSGSDLSNMDFKHAVCTYAKFANTCLAREICSLGGRRVLPFVRKVIMTDCNITGADFRGAFWGQQSKKISFNDLRKIGCYWDPKTPPLVSQ